jgi:hypothetical protein
MRSPNMKNTLETVGGGKGIKCESKITKNDNHAHNFKPKKGTKLHNVISEFLKGKKLSCLDHYWLGDTCLHSTVPKLMKRYGLTIPRERKPLPNRQGKSVSVSEYYFSDSDIAKMKPLMM